MHSAQTALALVERNVALDHLRVQPAGLELPPAEGTCKKSTVVFVHFRFNHESAWQRSFRESQISPAVHRSASGALCLQHSDSFGRPPAKIGIQATGRQ